MSDQPGSSKQKTPEKRRTRQQSPVKTPETWVLKSDIYRDQKKKQREETTSQDEEPEATDPENQSDDGQRQTETEKQFDTTDKTNNQVKVEPESFFDQTAEEEKLLKKRCKALLRGLHIDEVSSDEEDTESKHQRTTSPPESEEEEFQDTEEGIPEFFETFENSNDEEETSGATSDQTTVRTDTSPPSPPRQPTPPRVPTPTRVPTPPRVPTPVPPPSPPPRPATPPPWIFTMAPPTPQDVHVATHNALLANAGTIQKAIEDHDNGTAALSFTEVDYYLDEMKTMKPDVRVQKLNCFKLYSDVIDATTGTKPQDDALATHKVLEILVMKVTVRLTELRKLLEPASLTSKLETPKFGLPKFNGQHGQWPTFKNNFEALVVKAKTYSNTEKMRLLIDALADGDAKDTISDLQVTEGNWDISWKRVVARYDSPRESTHAAIRPFIDLPALTSQTEGGLHKLISALRTTRAQLLLVDTNRVPEAELLYLHLLLAKMDNATYKQFNETLTDNKVPKLETCVDFLEKKAHQIGLSREIRNPNSGSKSSPQPKNGKSGRILVTMKEDKTAEKPVSAVTAISKSTKNSKRSKQKDTPAAVNYNAKGRSPERQANGKTQKNPQARGKKSTNFKCFVCQDTKHTAYRCPKFLGWNMNQRRDWVRSTHRCLNCFQEHQVEDCKSQYSCVVCQKRHHTLLHQDPAKSRDPNAIHLSSAPAGKKGLLATALVTLKSKNQSITGRCLVDCGAQDNFITEEVAQKLKLPILGSSEEFTVAGCGSIPSLGRSRVTIQSRIDDAKKMTVDVFVLPEITSDLPSQPFDVSHWNHLDGLLLADPKYNQPGPIDMLLGVSVVDNLLQSKKITGPAGTPSAYPTDYGYLIMGSRAEKKDGAIFTVTAAHSPDFNFDMERFWKEQEGMPEILYTPEEQFVEEHYKKTTIRRQDGRYQIEWPFVDEPSKLGFSHNSAIKRWISTERGLLRRSKEVQASYHAQLQEYLDNDLMELVPEDELEHFPNYYMPHHAVIKESSTSTKVRVVFDASAPTTTGKSLNSIMAPGPTIQPLMIYSLIMFRLFKIPLAADIVKMYVQIFTSRKMWDFARIVWRKSPEDPLRHYRIKVIPFGVTAAPFCAIRTLIQLARDEASRYPLASELAQICFYVDDFMASCPTLDNAIQVKDELLNMLATAGFSLKKWSSSSRELLASLPPGYVETQIPLDIEESPAVKTLGLQWLPKTDEFCFRVLIDKEKEYTKRNLLSTISKIFDPLGFLGPVIVKAKMLMQAIWSEEVDWDDTLPPHIVEQWLNYAAMLPNLEKIRIPRCLGVQSQYKMELHGFCDASEKAYAASIYLRGQRGNDVFCNLVMSKTRVAPVKILTLPKLELQGAVTLAHLMHHLQTNWKIEVSATHYWTDSTIVLNWLNSSPTRWKIYVANRVNQIQEVSSFAQWHHVRSEDNAADCASRGLSPEELRSHHLWWHGPQWLQEPTYEIPDITLPPNPKEIDEAERKKIPPTINAIKDMILILNDEVLHRISKISSWKKAIHVLTLVNRMRLTRSFRGHTTTIYTPAELSVAERTIILLIQRAHYRKLYKMDPIKLDAKEHRYLRALNPFIDSIGLLRVGGRLLNADLPYEAKHPAIIPGSHPLIKALIMDAHIKLGHAGKQAIHAHLRQQYWIPSATKYIKSTISNCLICFRYHAQPMVQMMGQLPSARVNQTRPFLKTSVDYAGPFALKPFVGRKNVSIKVWIAVFTCMATRAIHLEIVSSLTYEGFLLAFRRFISRRGKPAEMYSDNGLNFVGANNAIQAF